MIFSQSLRSLATEKTGLGIDHLQSDFSNRNWNFRARIVFGRVRGGMVDSSD